MTTIMATRPRLGPCPCAGAERTRRPPLVEARALGDCRGRFAAVLGRDHRAGVRAGARVFWIGVASTFAMGLGTAITVAIIATLAVGARGLAGRLAKAKPGAGMLLLRGLETAAALVIVAFGALLLTGYIVSERLMGSDSHRRDCRLPSPHAHCGLIRPLPPLVYGDMPGNFLRELVSRIRLSSRRWRARAARRNLSPRYRTPAGSVRGAAPIRRRSKFSMRPSRSAR